MGITYLDLILAALAVLLIGVEMKRGFGRTLFDFVALISALYVTSLVSDGVATTFGFAEDASTNRAMVYLVLCICISAVFLLIGKHLYDSTLLTLDAFDPLFCIFLAVGVAIVCGHAVTQTLALMGAVDGKLPPMLAQSSLGMEFYDFTTYHRTICAIGQLGS